MNASVMAMMPQTASDTGVLNQQPQASRDVSIKSADTTFSNVLKKVADSNAPVEDTDAPSDKEDQAGKQNDAQSVSDNNNSINLFGTGELLTIVPILVYPQSNDTGNGKTDLAIQPIQQLENTDATLSISANVSSVSQTFNAQTFEGQVITPDLDNSKPSQNSEMQKTINVPMNFQNVSSQSMDIVNDKSILAAAIAEENTSANVVLNQTNAILLSSDVKVQDAKITLETPVAPTAMEISADIPKVQYSAYGMKIVPSKVPTVQEIVDPSGSQTQSEVKGLTDIPKIAVTEPKSNQDKSIMSQAVDTLAATAVSAAKSSDGNTIQIGSASVKVVHESVQQLSAPGTLKDQASVTDVITGGSTLNTTPLQAQKTDSKTNAEDLTTIKTMSSESSSINTILEKQPIQELQSSKDTPAYVPLSTQIQNNDQGIVTVDSKTLQGKTLADKYDVVSQIIENAKMINRTNNSEMVIQLKPEHLGEITLKVLVENGSVTTTFHSNNPEVRSVIEASISQLKQEMSNQGLKVEYVGVYAGLSQFTSQQQRESQQQPVFQSKSKKQAVGEFGESMDAVSQVNSTGSVDGVDYRI